jgi:hypothetical protein
VTVYREVFSAHGGVERALHEDVFDCLDGSATWACYLVWSVEGEKMLCVFPGEGMSCNKSVEG